MTPFVPFPNGAQVWLLFTLDAKVISNRLWFWNSERIPTSSDLQGLADGVYAWHTSMLMPYLSQDLVLGAVVAYDWSTDPPPFEVASGGPVAGGIAEESHSANVAASVPFSWPNQYRRLRKNKNFVPGLPDSAIELNTITPDYQVYLFEAYAALIDAARTWAPDDFWYWVVTSSVAGGVLRDEMFFGEAIGPATRGGYRIGQRRTRLPDP